MNAYHLKYIELTKRYAFDALAGLPLAGLPIAMGLSLYTQQPLCYPRTPKSHGTRASIEGGLVEGSHLLMIDDLATRGVSALEALSILRADFRGARHHVHHLLVLIDRESGAGTTLAAAEVKLHSVITLSSLVERWRELNLVSDIHLDATIKFIEESS